MFASAILLATAFEVGPFYQQTDADAAALRPFWSQEGGTTDVLWPVFTAHRDWWRFCWFTHYQKTTAGGYQFEVMPLWFNGRTSTDRLPSPALGRDRQPSDDLDDSSYWGLFPIWGHHPHVLLMYDVKFCLWPLWTQYKMPRPREKRWMTTNAVLFPFFHWRDDGAWGFWPVYGINHQRESDHQYVLWPIVTWADYRPDRDTAGEGTSWMVWPLYGRVRRAYERQDSVLPPLFSVATATSKKPDPKNSFPTSLRVRCPWPIFEYENVRGASERLSVWPLYERTINYEYSTGRESSHVTRFGWKLVELYDDEARVFPFWTSRRDGSFFRLWPFWESETRGGVTASRLLALFPIRWVESVDRNWAKFWTFYESVEDPIATDHSLLWGLIRWRTMK